MQHFDRDICTVIQAPVISYDAIAMLPGGGAAVNISGTPANITVQHDAPWARDSAIAGVWCL